MSRPKQTKSNQNNSNKNGNNQQHAVYNYNISSNPIDVRIIDDPILSEPGPNRVNYLEGLVSKQLDLYNWCEEKVSTLATMDSIMLGAATLVADRVIVVGEEATITNKVLNLIMIFVVLLPVLISLAISLWHIRPKMGKQSNTGRPNHRSSNGIRHFKTFEDYKRRVLTISDDDICEDLIKQIHGMNKNIWKNQRSIKIAVLFDLIGLLGYLVMLFIWVLL